VLYVRLISRILLSTLSNVLSQFRFTEPFGITEKGGISLSKKSIAQYLPRLHQLPKLFSSEIHCQPNLFGLFGSHTERMIGITTTQKKASK
jgi:hypothetical protein